MSIAIADSHHKRAFTVEPGSTLNVYICGPTVYTHSHVGHLKTYMTFDIIRRIFRDYFGISIRYMMNITNVDDKIIRATYEKAYGEDIDLSTLDPKQYLPESDFVEYADYWESEFFRVMNSVNIEGPDILSRVTEYIDEILEFVKEIDRNGLAFECDGSVYFYGTKYNDVRDDDNEYSKDPESQLNFVLLKKARPCEPSWDSEWGPIRPGWHIECSAMASSVFGSSIDIHGGGIDLAFPHHTNEVLQSDARFYPDHNDTWVRNFMHTGHLNIKGLKMSRSLKNFVTIDEILEEHDADNLRMLFLLHSWCALMDYSDDTMKSATYFVDFFKNFGKQVNSILLRQNVDTHKKYGPEEILFSQTLQNTRAQIDEHLRDNLDTRSVVLKLHDLASSLYTYVESIESKCGRIDGTLIQNTLDVIRSTLTMFGSTIFSNDTSSFEKSNKFKKSKKSKEQDLIKVISDIRTDLRVLAKTVANKSKTDTTARELGSQLMGSLFQMTDDIRDKRLVEIGVDLTDL